MDLIIVRCPDLESDGEISSKDGLSKKGWRDAESVVEWLKQHAPKDLRVLSSSVKGAYQFAQRIDPSATKIRQIGPKANATDLMAAAGWPSGRKPTLIVAHQPAVGNLVSLLLVGEESNWSVKKGAVWWLSSRRDDTGVKASAHSIIAVLTPSLLQRNAKSAAQGGNKASVTPLFCAGEGVVGELASRLMPLVATGSG